MKKHQRATLSIISSAFNAWKYEALVSFALLFIIFEIFFYKAGLRPLLMALAAFTFILLPGILLASLIFEDRFKKHELVIIGFGFGLIITPLLIYFVDIFEVMHARYLGFIIPPLLIVILSYLHILQERKKTTLPDQEKK